MKKKTLYILAGLIIIGIAIAIAYCSGHHDNNTAEEPQETTAPTAAVPEELDLTGEWYDIVSERSKMTITKGEGDNAYVVEVSWPESDTESVVWTFSGTFDPEIGFLYYQDGRKATVKGAANAAIGEETVEYEGGTGSLSYYDEALIWQDDKEDAGADGRYVREDAAADDR